MRQLQFRAYDKKTKKWLLGYEYKNLGGFSMFGECVVFGEVSAMIDNYLFERDGRKAEDLVIMQYTGLKDKNGKEIYEGDILQQGNKLLGAVVWMSEEDGFDMTGWVTSQSNHNCTPSEIIGNIYENPEKLK